MSRFRLGLAVTVSLLVLPALASVDPATLRRNPAVIDEFDFKEPRPPGLPQPITSRAAGNTLSYNGTTVDGPQWDRPIGCGPNISGLGPVRYHVQPFTVAADGTYSLSSAQTFDGYLHVYALEFNPAPSQQTLNCVNGNDDGQNGVGTSEVPGLTLAAGTQYFAVTSGFRSADKGTFTNTIFGSGLVVLGSGGPDVSVTTTPAVTTAVPGQAFFYEVKVSNFGPGVATHVTLDLEASANQTVEPGACGEFPLASLAAGASVSCSVRVALDGCGSATLTAVVDADGVDDPVNNLDTTRVNQNLVADGGFEAGTPSPTWVEASTRFSTPLCTVGTCGTGTGSVPRTGHWWAWFGGVAGHEESKLSQSVVIPAGGSAVLEFGLEMLVCSGNAVDFLEVTVDGEQVYRTDATSPLCGGLGYRLQAVDLSEYADGLAHSLELHGVLDSGDNTNFFVNDVSIASCSHGSDGGTEPPAIPTLSGLGLALLSLLVGAGAVWVLRRRAA